MSGVSRRTPEEARSAAVELLRERARTLAQAGEEAAQAGVPLVLFRRDGLRLGLRPTEVEGAGRLRSLSPVPGAPEWMRGALFHRGEVLTLVDLPAFWDQGSSRLADLPTYLVVGTPAGRLGVLAEELLGMHELPGMPAPYEGLPRPGLRGVLPGAEGAVLVLDAGALLEGVRRAVGGGE